jgi:hypothetical protein
LARLERLFADIQLGRLSEELLSECPELAAELSNIEKSEYRIEIMKRVNIYFEIRTFFVLRLLVVDNSLLN